MCPVLVITSDLMDKWTEECLQKHGKVNAAKSDLYVFGLRGSYLYKQVRFGSVSETF